MALHLMLGKMLVVLRRVRQAIAGYLRPHSPSAKASKRLWCAIRVAGVSRRPGVLSGDALGQRHAEPAHAVERRAADPGLGLLGGQSPSAKAATDDGLVPGHGRLPQRPPTVTGRFLPPQASLVPDQLDVAVPLVGAVPASGLGAAVERGGMTTSTGGSG